jgi:hypothetical protein
VPRKSAAVFVVTTLALLALVLIPATFAAKGGQAGGKPSGGGSSSLSLAMVADSNGNGLPNWGDQVTFNVSTTATDKPLVKLNCYQSGALVYTHSAGFYPGYPWPSAQTFTLSSGAWTGGAADCTAELYMSDSKGGFKTLKTLSVHVDA